MKRTVFALISAAVFIAFLTSCAGPAPEKSAESEISESFAETSSENSGESETPPVITGPDENGRFPLISYENWEKWFDPDAAPSLKIPDEEIPSITEYKDFEECLAEFYLEIDDWELIYEENSYELTLSYDPYSYCFGEMYTPHHAAVLKTEQGEGFDRLVVSSSARFWAEDTEGILPAEKRFYAFYEARESEIEAGDFSGVKFYRNNYGGFDSAFFEDEQKELVFDEDGKIFVILGIDKYAEIILEDKRSGTRYTYKMSKFRDPEWNLITVPESRKNDRILSVVTEKTKTSVTTVFAYYEAKTKALKYFDMPPFTLSSSKERRAYALDGENLLFVCGPDLYFCDMSTDADITKPFASLNMAENGLPEDGFIGNISLNGGVLYFSCTSAEDGSSVSCSFDINEHSLQKGLQ